MEEVFDPAAQSFGLAEGQVCVMVHCGSRGLEHQVGGDYVQIMGQAMARYGITVPDRQLACAPVTSPEGRQYLGAMAARSVTGPELRRRLERRGIAVRRTSARGLAEEAPEAYKDITQVVEAAEGAGLCRKVARLVPLGVIKG